MSLSPRRVTLILEQKRVSYSPYHIPPLSTSYMSLFPTQKKPAFSFSSVLTCIFFFLFRGSNGHVPPPLAGTCSLAPTPARACLTAQDSIPRVSSSTHCSCHANLAADQARSPAPLILPDLRGARTETRRRLIRVFGQIRQVSSEQTACQATWHGHFVDSGARVMASEDARSDNPRRTACL